MIVLIISIIYFLNVLSTAGVLNLGSAIVRTAMNSPWGVDNICCLPEIVYRIVHECVHRHFLEGDGWLSSDSQRV